MAQVSVVVPYRGDASHRDAVWGWLRSRWEHAFPQWQVVTGSCAEGPWRKAAAVRDAVARADGDVIIVADADVWCDGVAQAVVMVRRGERWAVPHRQVRRLTERATGEVMAGCRFEAASGLAQRPYLGHIGGGMVVLPRRLLDEVPMDARFAGWGQEDDSWGVALTTLAGKPWRGTDPLWHLWHPPAERLNRQIGSHDGERLYRRYLKARRDPQRMRALLEEANACS